MMNSDSPLPISTNEYIRAAPDLQLSSSQSNLLSTLLKEEDQYQYYQLINTSISIDIQHLLHQLCSLLHLSSSAIWMTTILLKKLIIQHHSLDLFIIVACVTLSSKYQDASSSSSLSQSIDYELLAQCCHIDNIQHIHNTELHLLDIFSYDVHVSTPDHFFSYLSNLDHNFKEIVEQARSLLSHQTYDVLHNYPCSIVALSLMYNITSNTFIIQQIKSFLQHKKDPSHYLDQLTHCIAQLQQNIL